MGWFAPSSVAPTYPSTTTANLSVPTNPPGILDVPAIPKPLAKAPSKPATTWAKPYPIPAPLLSPVESDWSSEDWTGWKQKEREAGEDHEGATKKDSRSPKMGERRRECPIV